MYLVVFYNKFDNNFQFKYNTVTNIEKLSSNTICAWWEPTKLRSRSWRVPNIWIVITKVKNRQLFNIRLEVIKHKCQTTLLENLNIYHYISFYLFLAIILISEKNICQCNLNKLFVDINNLIKKNTGVEAW